MTKRIECKWCDGDIYESLRAGKKLVYGHTETKEQHCGFNGHIATPKKKIISEQK